MIVGRWRELVSAQFRAAKFNAPARPDDIRTVEQRLRVTLPAELEELLLESNGVAAQYGAPYIWSTDEIVSQNLTFREPPEFRELYMPFDCLLFFGAEGNGDQFAYRILNGSITPTSWIYEWDHESDNREWFARDLKDYFARCVVLE